MTQRKILRDGEKRAAASLAAVPLAMPRVWAAARMALPHWRACDGRAFGDFIFDRTTLAEVRRGRETSRRGFLPAHCLDVITQRGSP